MKKEVQKKSQVIQNSLFTENDIYLFKQGTHYQLYDKFGSHLCEVNGVQGVHFSVWAPNAEYVSVIGDFNFWNTGEHPLTPRSDHSGIWEGFIPDLQEGTKYKLHVSSKYQGYKSDHTDPYGFYAEVAPQTASIVRSLDYEWGDSDWMSMRQNKNSLDAPVSVYELHLGSWKRKANNQPLNYRELAHDLAEYMQYMNFTHVELMPVMEHPFYGSWGYQSTGYFSPTSRYGSPQDFMYFVDHMHKNGIGIILDWVPSHFPSDGHGLAYFDGTHLFEHADPQKGFHPDWNCYIFNNGRNEVKEFLMSSAFFWMDKYHIDGLRVDAVASMLYLDYSRKDGEWQPNIHGGRENLESIEFLQTLNKELYGRFPGIMMVAEESTAWGGVSRPVETGGLGFGMKWNMGWMHDTLKYLEKDPVYRKYHHSELTFSMLYAFTENFMLSLSHDEVVHGKGSLLDKMPGDDWQKFANLRLLYGYMFGHPGKKLLFMGAEIAQWSEWNHESSMDWHLVDYDRHKGIQNLVKDLNHLHRDYPALHQVDFSGEGFHCVDSSDWQKSILSFIRKGKNGASDILVVCNFTPSTHKNYYVGVPQAGFWKELLNTDAKEYGGSGVGNSGGTHSTTFGTHGFDHSLALTIPPLSVVYFQKT